MAYFINIPIYPTLPNLSPFKPYTIEPYIGLPKYQVTFIDVNGKW